MTRFSETRFPAEAQRRKEDRKANKPSGFYYVFSASLRLCASFLICIVGASVGADEAAKTELPLLDADREHWAFVTPVRPTLPEVKDAAWCRTPIDRFILAKLEAAGLNPAPEAEPAVWLRRTTFDLTGLPPTVEATQRFVSAVTLSPSLPVSRSRAQDKETGRQGDREKEFTRAAEALLASRAYAERRAQHWLDLARYADSDGYEHDNSRPEAWRYRDWVIEAFARDLPFDEFLRRQIAGDELLPGDAQAAVATGFLLCGPDMPDLNRQDERRSMILNEVTSTIGASLLALQIGCAQCHDHKFEPLSQADFYRLRACFETSQLLTKAGKDEDSPDDARSADGPRTVRDSPAPWPESRLLIRGDFQRPGPVVEPGFPRVANPMNVTVLTSLKTSGATGGFPTRASKSTKADTAGQAGSGTRETTSSGRRTALASWLTRADHPLVARVFVNRVWQQHFGYGLVRTASDFGYLGDVPSHPELLDWLAVEFIDSGWSVKHLHQLIVTSSVYRQSGGVAPASDRQNLLLSHFPRRRLDGEAIRDAMLAAGERLSDRHGGPGVMPALPQELLGTIRKDHWKVDKDEENHRRRSIYLFVRRNLRLPLLEAFDRPDTMASCPRRETSTVAPQALVLLNSEFARDSAEGLAASLKRHSGNDASQQVERAYLATLGRKPTDVELKDAAALITADDEHGLADLCLALFNLNEFVYVD